ncbi:MAG: T9SS C-terminal target domain-containing protein [Chryseobacterium sp.]|nr:MAG: T9SS C-terminal target domain-containing protein [Chryseobacterium sp.]
MATQLSLKRKIIALLSLFYCVFSAAQGTEGFESLANTAGTSYTTLSFTGADNTNWELTTARIVNTADAFNINGTSALLNDKGTVGITFPSGVGNLKFSYRKAFKGKNARRIEVSVNGTVVDTTDPFGGTSGAQETVYTYSRAINAIGATTITIKSLGAQVTVDDFLWTALTATTTYNGTSWDGGIPDATKDAIIDADMTLTGVLSAKSLTVNAGKTLTLAGGSTLNVIGKITNDGSFIAEDGATVLQTENISNTGQFAVHKTSAPLYRNDFVLWSAPTTGMTLKEYSPNTLDNRFYTFDEPTNAWTAIAASTQFVPGRAYQFRAPNNFSDTAAQAHTGLYTGTLNNGSYTAAVTRGNQGYNLLGNPYPSTLDAETFLQSNPLLEGTLYFYMHSNKLVNGAYAGNNWAVYNASGAVPADNSSVLPTKDIAPGQGFMVVATASGSVTFDNGMRTADTAVPYRNSTAKDRLWLKLTDNSDRFSTMLLAFMEDATDGWDQAFDAEALSTDGHAVFTRIDGRRLKIDGRGAFSPSKKILLGLDAREAGTYRLSIADKDGRFENAEQPIYILDKKTGQTADLTKGFSFSAEAGLTPERFELSFEKSVLATGEKEREGSFVVVPSRGRLHIRAAGKITALSLIDMGGRPVSAMTEAGRQVEIDTSAFAKGVYLIRATVDGKELTRKTIIK